jgi:hypothetical protein
MVGDFNREMVRRIALTEGLPRRQAKDIGAPRRLGAILVSLFALANMLAPLLGVPHRHSIVAVITAEVFYGVAIVLGLLALPRNRMERGYVFVGSAFGVLALGMLVMGV